MASCKRRDALASDGVAFPSIFEMSGPLIERLETVIKDVGRDNGFSAILRTDTPGLEYRREALDVTDLVIKTYNGKG